MKRKVVLSLLAILLLGGLTTGCALGDQPEGWSGGVVANGTLFLGSMEGKLIAIDVSSHNRLWDVTLETSKSAGGFLGGCAPGSTTVAIYGTLAVSGDLVYVGGYNGKIYAYSSSSGQLRWVYPREGNLGPIVSGLVVALGKVYFGSSGGKVYALDADTGDKEWEFEAGDKIWSTPAIDGETLYIGSFDNKLYALDAITGMEKWGQPFETQGAIASSPVVYNNTVYFGSFDRHFYAVNATDGKKIWQFPVGTEVKNKPENWFWAKPVVYNNTIYAGNLDGKVYVLNTETGLGKVDPIDFESPISSSPVLVGSLVIVASEEGKVYSLDTETSQIKPLATVGEKTNAPLFVSEEVVYVHTQEPDTLYALNVETGVTLWSLPLSSK